MIGCLVLGFIGALAILPWGSASAMTFLIFCFLILIFSIGGSSGNRYR